VTTDREQLLSEFIDAWTAGRRPEVDDYLARASVNEQAELASALSSFLRLAPTPAYSDAAMSAIRLEPIVAEASAGVEDSAGILPGLLQRLRSKAELDAATLAGAVVAELELPADRVEKTASYLGRLESGELEPARVSQRVFDALARVLRVPRAQLEGAADIGGWGARPAMAAGGPLFRAEDDAAAAVSGHLDVLADALEASGGAARDEVDELFLGGR